MAEMTQPPHGALVAFFDRDAGDGRGTYVPVVLERDDFVDPDAPDTDDEAAHWYTCDELNELDETGLSTWAEIVKAAAESGRTLVRLYRADDPAIAVVPAWRGHLGDFMFSGHRVAVTGAGALLVDDTVVPMSGEQAERLGLELLAAARAKVASA